MKLVILSVTIAIAALSLGACKHRKQTPVATPATAYGPGYGSVK